MSFEGATFLANSTNSSAPQSSKRGIVEPLNGATLVFEHKRLACHIPLWSLILAYKHVWHHRIRAAV